MTRDQLHAMCKDLELALSGNKQALLARVAGVLASQENAWGKVKKSLRRPKGPINVPQMAASSTASQKTVWRKRRFVRRGSRRWMDLRRRALRSKRNWLMSAMMFPHR